MTELASRVTELAEPLSASLGLSLWGVEVQLGPRSIVRVYVERDDGVSIEQCAELSRLLGLTLEVEDILEGAYVLEVSSPGLERVFFTSAQLSTAIGKPLEVALYKPVPEFPGCRKFIGTLAGQEGETLVLALESSSILKEQPDTLRVAFSDTKKVRQLFVLPDKTPPSGKAGKKSEKPKKDQCTEPVSIKEGTDASELV